MGAIKHIVNSYVHSSDTDRWDDLFGAAMLGAAIAIESFDDTKGDMVSHIRRGARNHVIMELRKMRRWDKERPFSKLVAKDTSFGIPAVAGRSPRGGDDENLDDVTYETSVSANQDEIGNTPLWVQPTLNPEEQYLREEVKEQVNQRIAKLIPKLGEREQFVFWNNIHTDSPVSVRDIAEQFRVGKSSIHRDKKRVMKLLKEVEL